MTTKLFLILGLILAALAIAYFKPIREFLGLGSEFLARINRFRDRGLPSSPSRWLKIGRFLRSVLKNVKEFMDKYVFLQTFGNTLIDQKIKLHLTLYGLFILAMGLLEASAWSYLGFLFGHDGIAQWLCAIGVFVLVFFLVWGMDVSLALHDTLAERMSREFDIPYEQHGPGLKLAVPIRMAMLAASSIIAAPLLASIVFRADIETQLRNTGASAIDAKRDQIVQKHDANLTAIDTAISSLQHRLDLTLIGKGDHPGTGCGVECVNLQDQLAAKKQERAVEIQAERNELAAFSHDAANWQNDPETLQVKWNVPVPRISVLTSAAVLKTLENRDDFRHVEWAIRFLFMLAFGSVIICKLYESHAVALYNNSILQGLYLQDPPNHPISAEHFYKRTRDQVTRRIRDSLIVLKTQAPELEDAVRTRKESVNVSSAAHEAVLSKLDERKTQRDLQQKRVERCAEDARNFQPELYTPAARWMVQQEHRTVLEEEEQKLAHLDTEIRSLARSVERAEAEYNSIDAELKHFSGRLRELRQKIAELESGLITGNNGVRAA